MDNQSFKIMMLYKDGTQSPVSEVKDLSVNPCLSDPKVNEIVRGLLRITNQTEGTLVIWGRDICTTTKIIDDTKITKKIEEAVNARRTEEASS